MPNLVLDTINEFAVPLDFDEAYYPLIIYFDNLNEKPYESISPGTEFKYDNLLSFLNEGIPSINLLSAVESKIASITGLSDICDSIIYVPLETFHDVVLSRISHIIVDQDRVFLSDQNDGIYVFNFDGKLMSKIGCKGSGPEEYQSLIAGKFSIDALKKEILIPDFIGQKILVYTFDNVLRAKIKLPYRVTDISSLNDELYILYIQSLMDRKDSFNPIRVIDRSGTESFMVKSFNYPVLNFISAGQFEKFNEDIFYTEPNNDTIFKISYDLKKTPDNVIRLGKYKPPIEIYQDINRWIDYYSEYVYTKNIFHCSEGILFALYFKDLTYSGLYRYTDKTPIIFYLGSRNKGIVDNIDNGPPFNSFFRVSNGYIIDILEPMILRSEVYSRVRKESKLHKIMSLSEIEDNPIIRLIKLKYEI